ncbi:SIMPL domain-containing protein [Marinobacter lutaoensis]|uniref:SIMPL domain-containing protein n=1 Tax=Marinobacter lutaoensis TaxID=135739 RepID=A0A1V2DXK8_9GAMM|nr:SIMPL domain-containing protein [Marinobacter lutaoensis]ONF45116.1 SIMPL domain-containing protein [Marinobacter lutaoensis]
MTERKQHPLALAAALAGLISTPALAGELSLSGEGSVRYEPDSVRLQFTASAEHALAARASEQVQALMERWRSGIEPWRERLDGYSDARLNLYTRTLPATERNEPPRQQAVASQTVSFNLHDLSLLNPILAKAQALGFTYNLGPQNFYHSDQAQLERQALAQAIADARSRCEFVATELGQSCSDVVTMSINGGFRPVPMMMAEARSAKDVVAEVGVRDVTASVSVTFELD